jgi:hypothetical protein
MSIVSHQIVWGSENGTRYTVTYKFTSHIGYEPALDIQKLIVRDEAAAEMKRRQKPMPFPCMLKKKHN